MPELRLVNELGLSATLLTLEPARRCVCHCTYCFAHLNRLEQAAGNRAQLADPGSFERKVERAFSAAYDPTDVVQYQVRNRYPAMFASTVEPFQDAPQARSTLKILHQIGLPVLIQTKGHNVGAVWDDLLPLRDNAALFLSFPTDDDRALRRFEVGAPPAAERWAVLEAAVAAGLPVILALAPYHEDWNPDPAGFLAKAAEKGVRHVFVDRLHVNDRQRRTAKDRVMVDLAGPNWSPGWFDHAAVIADACAATGLGVHFNNRSLLDLGIRSTIPTYIPEGSFRRGRAWPYIRHAFTSDLEALALDAEEGEEPGPIVVTWAEALKAMERDGGIEQPMSWSSMRQWMAVRHLPPAWKRAIGPGAPPREYMRALWNTPRLKFPWKHPFARIAMRPDGGPWRDEAGNIVMVFDSTWARPGPKRVLEDLDSLAFYVADGDGGD